MLRIEKRFIDEMVAHALAEAPNECCGLMSGSDHTVSRLYRITNLHRSPSRYVMAPQEQLNAMLDSERNGLDVVVIYHSHTRGEAYPSQVDVRLAQQSGWLGEGVYYMLVGLIDGANPQVRAFHIFEDGKIAEQEFEVV
ncbi:MAG: M67 family metallopeptidase [Chloroflexi bacterium]|nr:M67 family metallopeptidase [Chloroflexota bacterium]